LPEIFESQGNWNGMAVGGTHEKPTMELYNNGMLPRRDILRREDIGFDILSVDDLIGYIGYVKLSVLWGIHFELTKLDGLWRTAC
jgi:hypothetical protein